MLAVLPRRVREDDDDSKEDVRLAVIRLAKAELRGETETGDSSLIGDGLLLPPSIEPRGAPCPPCGIFCCLDDMRFWTAARSLASSTSSGLPAILVFLLPPTVPPGVARGVNPPALEASSLGVSSFDRDV